MNIFKRRKILKNTNALELVPLRIVSHTEEEGKVILLVPKFESKLIHNLFPVADKLFFRIKLDENGTKAWNAMDGAKSVAQIAESFSSTDMAEGEASSDQNRLLKFISLLYEKEFISFRQLLV